MPTFAKWWIFGVICLHILGTVLMVDKPRRTERITAAHAILTTVFWGMYALAILYWWET